MTWQDGPVTVHIGDALTVLREMPAESVHCVVTSPPYWGLRDYGIPGQLGLEATPEEYIARMVEVFKEVRRVLRPDGTLWLNMGDSYASGDVGKSKWTHNPGAPAHVNGRNVQRIPTGLKPKDLVGIAWRLAFALQADGWWLRSDIIWSKPNPMPESVTDRPTKAHEFVFLLTKQARYFYDADAVREPQTSPDNRDNPTSRSGVSRPEYEPVRPGGPLTRERIPMRNREWNPAGRNLRSVWTIATQPYPEAHFATFPEELARRCIAAGTSERGCCPECGAPWRRVVETNYLSKPQYKDANGETTLTAGRNRNVTRMGDGVNVRTTGWFPSCYCKGIDPNEPISATVLDPFAGSGTTLAVARRMGRRAVGIELQSSYLPLIQRRVSEAALPLLEAIT